jgi:hypothetical protein
MRDRIGKALLHISQSGGKMSLAIGAFALIAGGFEYLVMIMLRRVRLVPALGDAVDSLLIAVLAGVIAWLMLTGIRERRRRVLSQLQLVAELNLNVRTALEAILVRQYNPDMEQTVLLIQSLDRIDKTLTVLVPTFSDNPAASLLERALRQERLLSEEIEKLQARQTAPRS